METKPNWLVRHINLITAAVALYPWLLMDDTAPLG